jgi:hypothetical protein
MSRAQRLTDSIFEADLRAEARQEALRALSGYRSPSIDITPAELAGLRDSNTSERAGTAGDLPPSESQDRDG